MVGSGLSILLLEDPGGRPRDDSMQGVQGSVEHHLRSECRYMLRRVRAAIVCLKYYESKVLWDWLVLNLRTKGDPPMELSQSSSFDLMNSFWTSSIHQLISRSCALSKFVESEERVSSSGML
ncbi:hypothetical protein B296_00010803 [Ensete ventricosum]|uniref:Uncharacterized protein n=1 Tax=Ensete ventricosum TaxID=4639 RepID=A0A427AQJ9_ENSVE|nr:hypothetical protein B296_00010803 [Ensete ventricosum]